MASYEINVPEVGHVRVNKRRGMKTIRLRINARGDVVVSAPWYVSRGIINTFLQERRSWIVKNTADQHISYKNGMLFGQNLKLRMLADSGSNHSKIIANELIIKLKEEFDPNNKLQQKYIEGRMIKCLQTEAEHSLLPQLHNLALVTGIVINQAFIKNLTGRWGSCDSNKNIHLSLFLVQVPKELAEYVMIHELAHAIEMNHSSRFWAIVETHCPNYKVYRKLLKQYKPRVTAKNVASNTLMS